MQSSQRRSAPSTPIRWSVSIIREKARRTIIIICFIDDASRVVPHGAFYAADDTPIVARLRRNLSPVDRAALLDDLACAPAWIADIFRQVATDPA